MQEFEASGIPFSPIARPVDMYDDPHVNRPSGLFVSQAPGGRSFRAPGLPFEINGIAPSPASVDLPAIGADTQKILGGLGLDSATIRVAGGERKYG